MTQRTLSRYPLATDLLLLLAIGGTVLFAFLGQNRAWASREIRHAEIMREMAVTGDFLVPRVLGQIYYDKPPVMHSLGAALMRATGQPNLFFARFPSALAALVSVLAVYGLGRLMGGRSVGWWAALALLSMPGLWIMARVARPDVTLVALILLSCLCLGWAMWLPKGVGKAGWLFASGIASALAIITKGPFGLLVPLLFLGLAPQANPDLKRPRWAFLWFVLGLATGLTAWAWPVYARDGGAYLKGVIFQKDLTSGGATGHYEPFYWYAGPLLIQTVPVILFLPMAIQQWRREKRFPAALVIAGVLLVILSFVPGKRRHYLLPMFPFLALGLATAVASFAQQTQLKRRIAAALLAAGIAAGPLYYGPILRWLRPHGDPEWRFITEVSKTLPPTATAICVVTMDENLAWVGRGYGRIVQATSLSRAKEALLSTSGDVYLVAPEPDLAALEKDPDLKPLKRLLRQKMDNKDVWTLTHLER